MLKNMFQVDKMTDCIFDELQNAWLCMVSLTDGTQIELVSGDVVDNFLKRKQYLYHTCFTTSAIEKEIDRLVALGAFLVSEPKKAVLFQKRVAFLMTEMGLVELLEE